MNKAPFVALRDPIGYIDCHMVNCVGYRQLAGNIVALVNLFLHLSLQRGRGEENHAGER